MLFKQYKYLDGKVFQSDYSDLEDLLTHIQKAPTNFQVFKVQASQKGSQEFTKTASLDEAIQICRDGYHEGFDNFLSLKEELDTHLPAVAYRRYPITDTAGFAPNVGAYLSGSPKSMYRLAPQEENKFLIIYFNCSYSKYTRHDQILHNGIITLALVQLLELVGYRVDLKFFELSTCERNDAKDANPVTLRLIQMLEQAGAQVKPQYMERFIYNREVSFVNIKLKDAGDPIDIKNCYFPISHPSFLRRIMFRQMEVTQGLHSSWRAGYGMPMQTKECDAFIRHISGAENYILINNPDSMGVEGGDIVEDADRFLRTIGIEEYIETVGAGSLVFNEKSGLSAFEKYI